MYNKKYIYILLLLFNLVIILTSCTKNENVKMVEEKINSIGEPSINSKQAIKDAEEALLSLTESDRKKVENINKFEDAKNKYEDIFNKSEAESIDTLIENIGKVSLESESKINEARKMYDKSKSEIKDKVLRFEDLKNAEDKLKNIKEIEIKKEKEKEKQQKEKDKKQIESLKTKFTVEEDKVKKIKWYWSKSRPEYANDRSFVLPYIALWENGSASLIIEYHYTADKWIFWDNLTISIDGNNTQKNFNYYDITRDNEYGDIWEVYHNELHKNTKMSHPDIQELQKIVDSTETIVRFNGRKYYDDITISSSDKKAIKETLELYRLLTNQ